MQDTITHTCHFCYEAFQSQYPDAKYCSRYHKERARQFRRTGSRTIYPKRCPQCEQAFIGRQSTAIYCSDQCKRKRKALLREEREKQLAIKTKAFKQSIYFRDEGLCGVCGEHIYLTHKYPHPQSLSLDHIVPLAAGGAHALYNIQLAHWICNVNKSDKLIPSRTVPPHAD